MSNSKKIASVAFTGAAATAVTVMAAGPALAALTPFTIKNGGVLYTGVVKGKLKTGKTAVLVDTTKNTTLTCKKATFSGSVRRNTGSASVNTPVNVGVINAAAWSSCTGPFNFAFKAHLITTTKPNVSVKVPGAASTTGRLTGNKISGEISGIGLFNTCRAFVSGTSVPAKFVNASHNFKVNAGHAVTLHVRKISGNCAGAINVSDNAYFSAGYAVSVPAALTVS